MTKVEQALSTFPALAPEQQEAIANSIMDAALPVIEFGSGEYEKTGERSEAA